MVMNYNETRDSEDMDDAQFMKYVESWLDKADERAKVEKVYPVFAGRGAIRRLLNIARSGIG
jgi:hypothetical protein